MTAMMKATADGQVEMTEAEIAEHNALVAFNQQADFARVQAMSLREIQTYIGLRSQSGAVYHVDGVDRPVATDMVGIAHINAEITAITIAVRTDDELFFFADSPIGVILSNAQMTELAIAARLHVKKCVIAGNAIVAQFLQLTTREQIVAFDYESAFEAAFEAA